MIADYEPLPKWHEINVNKIETCENGEKLINISNLNSRIICSPHYYNKGIPNAEKNCYLRQSVYSRLLEALCTLPKGYSFKVFDAWRPYAVQKFLFEQYAKKIENSEHISFLEAMEKAKRFVSYPSLDEKKPFVHSTGGAIDLTIIDNNGKELNMGTEFDDFSSLAYTDHFDCTSSDEIRNNRRLLYYVMTNAGFSNYPSEWWHYDYGDAFWAFENDMKTAIFGGIFDL